MDTMLLHRSMIKNHVHSRIQIHNTSMHLRTPDHPLHRLHDILCRNVLSRPQIISEFIHLLSRMCGHVLTHNPVLSD